MYNVLKYGPNSALYDPESVPSLEMTPTMLLKRVANMAADLRLPYTAAHLSEYVPLPDETNEKVLQALDNMFTLELEHREAAWFCRNLRKANLKYPDAALDSWFLDPDRRLNTFLIEMLRNSFWIYNKENVLVTGEPGAGKTFLACALGNYALAQHVTVYYTSAASLAFELDRAEEAGHPLTVMEKYTTPELLILDDFGLISLDEQLSAYFFSVLAERAGNHSTIIVSSYPVQEWATLFPEWPYAQAILRRVTSKAHLVHMPEPSIPVSEDDLPF